jgi:hypothetical protein
LTPAQESNTVSFNGDVVDQQEAIVRVGQGGGEVEVCIGVVGTLILGVDRGDPDPYDVGGLESAAHGVLQQARAEAVSLRD